MSTNTIKVKFEGEIRKLKDITSFDDFLDGVRTKIKVDPDMYSFSYVDDDGDRINVSTAYEFDQCLKDAYPKVPKIELTINEQEESVDLVNSFANIEMTVSTCERPFVPNPAPGQSNDDQFEELKSPEDYKETTEQTSPPVNAKSSEADKELQTEDIDFGDSDEKGTSTVNDIVLCSSAIQTQSIDNINESTDVANLVVNQDQSMGTEVMKTEDKSNQKEVLLKDNFSDPLKIEIYNQATITNVHGDEWFNPKPVEKQPQLYTKEMFDEKLIEIVKHLMQEMTPMMIEECHKFVKQSSSENQQKDDEKLDNSKENNSQPNIEDFRNKTVDCVCKKWKRNTIFDIIFRCREWKSDCDSQGNAIAPWNNHDEDSDEESIHNKCKKLISSSNDDSSIMEESIAIRPAKQEPVEEEKIELPEMVKRSIYSEYKPFSDEYIQSLSWMKINPEDAVQTVNRNTDTFSVVFELANNDSIKNTRWPVNSTLQCLSPSAEYMVECTNTIKEIRAGEKATFHAKLKTPKWEENTIFLFTLIDDYARQFGETLTLEVKTINVPQLDLKKVVNEEEQHPADKEYVKVIADIKDMGFEITKDVKDAIVKFKGEMEDIIDYIQ